MYTFVTATCLSRAIGSQWEEKPNLNAELVYLIYQKYSKTYLTLTNPVIAGEVYVDFDVLKTEYANYQGTLSQLLIELGGRSLPTVPDLPSFHINYASYSDMTRVGYKIQLAKVGYTVPANYPEDDLHDLVITRPQFETDLELIHTHGMVSVNGYYHMTASSSSEKAYVLNGADTMRRSNNNHVGLWSFLEIGKLEKIRIDPENIRPVNAGAPLKDKIMFTVEEPLDGKNYILILGGYIVLLDNGVFWRSGEHAFTLDINQIPYVQRIFESSNFIDLSPLGLTNVPINEKYGYLVDELYSDETLKKYLTLSQSFLVLVDTPQMGYNKLHVRNSGTPGMFTSYQNPVHPMIVGYGRVGEYWKVPEDGYWSVNTHNSYIQNFVTNEQPIDGLNVVTSNLLSGNPSYNSRGFLLQVSGYNPI